jgi:hypothetical protein
MDSGFDLFHPVINVIYIQLSFIIGSINKCVFISCSLYRQIV